MDNVLTDRRSQLILCAVLVSATFAGGFNHSAIGSAVPEIALYFNIDVNDATWINSIYLLFASGFLLIFGKICDRGAIKKVLSYGLVAFMAGAALCMVFDSYALILVARAIQGMGASTIWCSSVMLGVKYLPKKLVAWGMASITAGEAMGLIVGGPTAGVLLTFFTWKAAFLPAILSGAVSLYLVRKVIPKDSRLEMSEFDYKGATMLLIAMFSGSYGLEVVAYDGFTPLGIALTLTFIVSLLLFIRFSKRASDPIIDLSVFNNWNSNILTIIYIFKVMVVGGIFYLVPLYSISILGHSSMEKGALMLVGYVAGCITSLILGKTMVGRNGRPFIILTSAVMVAASVLMLFVYFDTTFMIAIPLFVGGIVLSLGEVAVVSHIVNSAPDSKRGRVSVINSYLANLFVAVNAIVFSKLFTLGSGSEGTAIGDVSEGAFMNGFFLIVMVCLVISIISVVLSLKYKEHPPMDQSDEV